MPLKQHKIRLNLSSQLYLCGKAVAECGCCQNIIKTVQVACSIKPEIQTFVAKMHFVASMIFS